MIQIYVADNTNYDANGDVVLLPDTCTLDTSSWRVILTHPRDADGRWELIQDGAVLKLPTFLADDQLYRIINTEVTDSGGHSHGAADLLRQRRRCHACRYSADR